LDNTATFNKKFDRHNVTFLAGTVTESFRSNDISGSRINIPASSDQWYLSLGNPDVQSTNSSGGDLQARHSFVTRLSYAFADKYLLSASFRADGSSKFSSKWGYFPTVGAGWVMTDEKFMENSKFFNSLKLRGSWGRVGNDNIESNAYILTATTNIPYFFNNNIILGTVIQDIKDQQLKWESGEQLDIGFEFSILNKRLSGEADYYTKTTRNALANRTIPAIFGDPNNQFLTNIASFRNKGYELVMNWSDNIRKTFSYTLGGNLSFNKNRVIGLSGGQALLGGEVGQQSFVTRTEEGQPVGSFYVLKAIGVFQNQAEIDASPVYGTRADVKPGDLKYEDVSGPNGKPDGVIDLTYDRVFVGSYQPKVYYGFNAGLNFRGFDLTADFYGNTGNKIYNGKRAFRFQNTDNIEADYANSRWKADRPSTTNPRIITSATPASTYFIESGSFVRLNNLTLGFNFPAAGLQKIKIKSFRIYVTAQNLFTAKKFSGFSPELIGGPLDSGIELNAYPTTRTFAFGVNMGF
jgi:TonB-linked SusC/RagA family outer membrane protein